MPKKRRKLDVFCQNPDCTCFNNFDKSALAQEKKKLPLTEIRFISKPFEDLIFTEIYGNKVAIFIYSEQPSVIIIESEEVAKSYKRYFDILWKTTKK